MASAIRERQRKQKTSLACEPCRVRKSRCDGAKPICSSCQRRGLVLEQCVFSLGNARTASNDAYIQVLHGRIRQLERLCIRGGIDPSTIESLENGPDMLELRPDPDLNTPHHPLSPVINPPGEGIDIEIYPDSRHKTNAGGHYAAFPNTKHLSTLQRPTASQHISALPDTFLPAVNPSVSSYLTLQHRASDDQYQSSSNSAGHMHRPEGVLSSFERQPCLSPLADPSDKAASCSGVTAMGTISTKNGMRVADRTQKDFYGESSAASFMIQTIKVADDGTYHPDSTTGSSNLPQTAEYRCFTEKPCQETNHRKNTFALPTRQVADNLLHTYWRRLHYIYPWIHRPAVEEAYRSLWEHGRAESSYREVGLGSSPDAEGHSVLFQCALNAIFALACLFAEDIPSEERTEVSATFFLRCKALVDLDLIETNNVAGVQTFLLIALFLQSTQFPSRCWNAVGIACRMAHAMGLHIENTQDSWTVQEREIRRRTWYGCVLLDMHVSMTLGRPTMTTHMSNVPLPSHLDDAKGGVEPTASSENRNHSRMQFFNESIRLSKILEGILLKVYRPWKSELRSDGSCDGQQDPTSLQDLLELDARLSRFQNSVPGFLSWVEDTTLGDDSPDLVTLFSTQKNVLHARFHYLRVMLYRPLLLRLYLKQARAMTSHVRTSSQAESNLTNSGLSSSFETECGKLCVEAAMDLLKLVHRTYQTENTAGWWWNGLYASTSGLALIIAQSCRRSRFDFDHSRVQRHWKICQEILSDLSQGGRSSKDSLQVLRKIQEATVGRTGGQHREVILEGDSEDNYSCLISDNSLPDSEIGNVNCYEGQFFFDLDMLDTSMWYWQQNLNMNNLS
ncbi:fungal-specific transcription factor domain-containing protein [Ilyonectria destructans]|nr:fungal-specific transcription factor domain-containing protein [Ilyonectria destructans]